MEASKEIRKDGRKEGSEVGRKERLMGREKRQQKFGGMKLESQETRQEG